MTVCVHVCVCVCVLGDLNVSAHSLGFLVPLK
jgi:hypothetical protein